MNHARKKFERAQLDQFLRITGVGKQLAQVDESERPDFLLTLNNGRRIAVEHTQPRDEVHAANEGLLVSAVAQLRQSLDEHQLSLWVHMTLPLTAAQALAEHEEALAEQLTERIFGDRKAVQSSWVEYSQSVLSQSGILASLEEVHVSECKTAIATWGSKSLKQRLAILQEAIVNKTGKLLDYQSNVIADEFWLLVVAGPGLGCIPSLLASQLPYGKEYQRIYLMDQFAQHCFALQGGTAAV